MWAETTPRGQPAGLPVVLPMNTNAQTSRRTVAEQSAREQPQAEKSPSLCRRRNRRRRARPAQPRFARTVKAAKLFVLSARQDRELIPWHLSPPEEIDSEGCPKRCLAWVLKRRRASNGSAAPAQRVKSDRLRRILATCGFLAGFALATSGSVLHLGWNTPSGPAFMTSQGGTTAIVNRSTEGRRVESATSPAASTDSEPAEPATGVAMGFYLLLRATAEAADGRARLRSP